MPVDLAEQQTPQEAYRAAIGDDRANELFDAAMDALHAFAQHTDALAGTQVVAWFDGCCERAAKASFAAYRALQQTAPDQRGAGA